MTIARYELVIVDHARDFRAIELRCYRDDLETPRDYTVVDGTRLALNVPKTKTIDGLRKHGARLAKSNKVPFVDKTISKKPGTI